MATKRSESRSKLVSGCGTILKTNRLKGGYKLVKRKRPVGASAEGETVVKKKRGRKKATAVATVVTPAKRRGRPALKKATAVTTATAPAKRRGRKKATAVVTATAPIKRRGRKTATAIKTAPAKRRGRPARKTAKA